MGGLLLSRVEWSTLSGEEVESVIAFLINREHPSSIRITPSQGDGGVDILHRNGDGIGGDFVYQVKKFTRRLTAGQKKQIEGSLDRLSTDSRWQELEVASWILVLPLDPTPEEDAWFQELLSKTSFQGTWFGLNYVEQLAAKYPDVIDYYLHGHRDLLSQKMNDLVALFTPNQGVESLNAKESIPRLQSAVRALQRDPFYSYSMQVGDGQPPSIERRDIPNLVFTSGIAPASGKGEWAIVDIIARCAESVNLSPIEFSGHLFAEKDTDKAIDIQNYASFGKPLLNARFAGQLDAPGGFGGNFQDAVVSVLLHSNAPDQTELRLGVRSPDGEPIGQVDIDRTSVTQGADGIHAQFREVNGIFDLEITTLFSDKSARTISVPFEQKIALHHSWNSTNGRPITQVEPVFRFLAACSLPNEGVIGSRHIWPNSAQPIEWLTVLGSDKQIADRSRTISRWVRDLRFIQGYTEELITMPNLDDVSQEITAHWNETARLLSGEEVCLPNDGQIIEIPVIGLEEITTDRRIHVEIPLVCRIADRLVDLGSCFLSFDGSAVVDIKSENENQVLSVQLSEPGVTVKKEFS